jgi:hypothetical protein
MVDEHDMEIPGWLTVGATFGSRLIQATYEVIDICIEENLLLILSNTNFGKRYLIQKWPLTYLTSCCLNNYLILNH